MNVYLLEDGLKRAFEAKLVDLPLPTRTRSRRPADGEAECIPPLVFVGQEPPKTAAEMYDAPLVLIQNMAGHDEGGFLHATLVVRMVVWNEEPDAAENDLQNLLSLLRRTVLEFRANPLQGKWVAEAASNGQWCPWDRPDGQAPQFAQAYFLCHWHTLGF